jgi:hypothetical protein
MPLLDANGLFLPRPIRELGLLNAGAEGNRGSGDKVMKRLLLSLPLLAVPPALVAGYFLYLAPVVKEGGPEMVGTQETNLQVARTASERAGRFLTQARASSSQQKELLQQAMIQYRVCLAYEAGTTDAGRLFEDARHNLEASRLLLAQHQGPAQTRTARVTPVSEPGILAPGANAPASPVQPKPIARAEMKPHPLPTERIATIRNGEGETQVPKLPFRNAAAAKPLPTEEKVFPVKATAVGPDGVTFEPVDKDQPPR